MTRRPDAAGGLARRRRGDRSGERLFAADAALSAFFCIRNGNGASIARMRP